MAGYRTHNFDRSPWFSRCLLATVWMAGLLLGDCLFFCRPAPLTAFFCDAYHLCGSGISAACCSAVSMFISSLTVYLKRPWWLYLMCFIRAATFSFTASGVISAAGLIGWKAIWFDAFYLYIGRLMEYWFFRRYCSGIRELEPMILLPFATAAFLRIFFKRFLFM